MSYYLPISKASLNLGEFGIKDEPTYMKSDDKYLSSDGEVIYFAIKNDKFIAFIDDYIDINTVKRYFKGNRESAGKKYQFLETYNETPRKDRFRCHESIYNNPMYIVRLINDNK